MSIPASQIVSVIPGVLGAGGNGLVMNGLVLTENLLMPTGSVLPFSSPAAVSSFFGPASTEYGYSQIYFAGYEGATQLPSSILFAPYNAAARAAWLQSGSLATMTLAQLQALSGVLTISVNGSAITSATISLSTATSFTDAATLIEDGFTSPPFSVAWDAVQSVFIFTTTATGSTETISYASGTLAAGLNLTQTTGATLSQGANEDTPASAMNNATAVTQNFATVSYITEPTLANKELFAQWFSESADLYCGVMWDSDPLASVANSTEPFGVIALANKYNGIMCIGGDPAAGNLSTLVMNIAAFVQGMIASINYGAANGSITLAGKSSNASAAVLPACSNVLTYQNLLANGYSTYGAFAARNQGFIFFSNGNAPGQIPWADSYIDQIWLSSQLQMALLNLYTTTSDIPYDPTGYAVIRSTLIGQPSTGNSSTINGPINQAISNGVIDVGVTLSSSQAAAVNLAAGGNVAGSITANGFYLQILDPGAAAQQARKTPILNLWYTGREAIQQFTLSSINIL